MAIERITSAPPALSQEELDSLSASTPESFAGIPPLLRHKEEDVFWTVEPEYQGVKQGRGTLWVTEEYAQLELSVKSQLTRSVYRRLSFLSSASASAGESGSTGLSIPYENITLHALSRAPLPASSSQTNGHANGNGTTTATGPCVYCQINEFENEDADEYENSWEITIVPSSSESGQSVPSWVRDFRLTHEEQRQSTKYLKHYRFALRCILQRARTMGLK